jgi:hypothetical protein
MGRFNWFRRLMSGVDLDLNQDAADVYAYVASRASAYTPSGDKGLGGIGPIKMVYAGYEFDQTGWFVLIFDRRSDAGHDGQWTRYIDDHKFPRSRWVRAAVKNEMRPLRVRGEDGNVQEVSAGRFSVSVGRMLVGVLQRAERDGVFARLPLADDFRMGLEEFNGSFGWDSQMGTGGPG